jgi:hypothetical protein
VQCGVPEKPSLSDNFDAKRGCAPLMGEQADEVFA